MKSISTLNELLDDTAGRMPNRTALISEPASMTYSMLRTKVLKAAAAFRAYGIRQGDKVGICLRNSPDFIIAYFGLVRIGAAAVPINFMVRKVPELCYMLQDSEAIGIVSQKEFLPAILEAKKLLPGLRSIWSVDSADASKGVESFELFLDRLDPTATAVFPEVSSQELAAILYTSGTTGNPKGVMLSHGNLVSDCESSVQFLKLYEKDVMLCLLPMFHTFAWTACVLVGIRAGMKIVITPNITPPKPWLALMAKYGVTLFAAIPPIYAVLTREAHGLQGLALRYWFFRSVRLCISGAAPLSPEVMEAFQKAFGLPILEGYGLTETSPVATINPPDKPRPGSTGLPIKDVQIRVIDDREQSMPAGQEGEVCISGANVMLGYFHRPDDTRETFTSDGWLKTGDIGFIDPDGYLFLRGRKKDMIIIKGLKVFAAQVEQVISAHPLVEEAAVIGIPNASGDEIIKAFIVLKPGVETSKENKASLMQFFREKLDAYKRPRDIEFIESLPKNSLQKVLKRVLLQKELEKKG